MDGSTGWTGAGRSPVTVAATELRNRDKSTLRLVEIATGGNRDRWKSRLGQLGAADIPADGGGYPGDEQDEQDEQQAADTMAGWIARTVRRLPGSVPEPSG